MRYLVGWMITELDEQAIAMLPPQRHATARPNRSEDTTGKTANSMNVDKSLATRGQPLHHCRKSKNRLGVRPNYRDPYRCGDMNSGHNTR